jgi:hypothetical protein
MGGTTERVSSKMASDHLPLAPGGAVRHRDGRMLGSLPLARLARLCLLLSAAGIVVLHLLPRPVLEATTGQVALYDPRLNFLSEYVRTQYGPLMTFNFVTLAGAAVVAAWALRAAGLGREAKLVAVAAVFLALLAVFPTDLVDLRRDGAACDDPLRIEPCTWVGRVHNPLSTVVFCCLGATWLSLASRRRPQWRSVVWAGVACSLLAAGLVGGSAVYSRQIPEVGRHWIGMMQRSVVVPALVWLWLLLGHGLVVEREKLPAQERSRKQRAG